MRLSGNPVGLGLRTPGVSPTPISDSLVVLIALTTVILALGSPGEGRAPVLDVIEIAMPGALLSIALLVTHTVGRLNVALGGAYVLGLVVLGLDGSPNDMAVVGSAVGVLVICMFTGWLLTLTDSWVLAGLFGFFMLRGWSLTIGGNVGRSSDFDDTVIGSVLRYDIAGVSVGVVLAVVAAGATAWLLGHSSIGRRIRAYGLGSERALLSESRPIVPLAMAHLTAGLLVALSLMVGFARLGTSSSSTESALLLEPLVALIVGNGGMARSTLSTGRVFIAFILVEFLRNELALSGFSSVSTDLVFALFALAGLLLADFGRRGRAS